VLGGRPEVEGVKPVGGAAGSGEYAARYGVEARGGAAGASKSSTDGSPGKLGRTGETETRLPQRVRAMERPSVMTASPFARVSFFLVQKTLLPTR
jgi:hypothetical protein